MSDTSNSPRKEQQKVIDLVSKFQTAMLVTHGANGQLHARPMMVGAFDGREITFLTAVDSNKATEISHDQRVSITFQGSGAYMSMTGYGRIERDTSEARKLWSPVNKAWFDGPDDPRLSVLRVTLETAEYWDNRGRSLLRYAVDTVRSRLTQEGDAPKAALHGVVDLS